MAETIDCELVLVAVGVEGHEAEGLHAGVENEGYDGRVGLGGPEFGNGARKRGRKTTFFG